MWKSLANFLVMGLVEFFFSIRIRNQSDVAMRFHYRLCQNFAWCESNWINSYTFNCLLITIIWSANIWIDFLLSCIQFEYAVSTQAPQAIYNWSWSYRDGAALFNFFKKGRGNFNRFLSSFSIFALPIHRMNEVLFGKDLNGQVV